MMNNVVITTTRNIERGKVVFSPLSSLSKFCSYLVFSSVWAKLA